MDFGGYSTSTRKLSMVVQLTDPSEYEGGKLQFMINRSVLDAPNDKGTVIFFPAYLNHRVTQLTKGKRNSLVFWFHGPTFI
jgi:PKHD-type hydroxylase